MAAAAAEASLRACTKYSILQYGDTCYFAVCINILLCTEVFRNYLTRVYNTRKGAFPPGFFDGPYDDSMDFMDMLLHVVYKQTCSASVTAKRVLGDRVDKRLLKSLFGAPPKGKEGGFGEIVLLELLKSLGITVGIGGKATGAEDVLFLTHDEGSSLEVVHNRRKYTLVAGMSQLVFSGRRFHELACLKCGAKFCLFDSNGHTFDIDWRKPAAAMSAEVCANRQLYGLFCEGTKDVVASFSVLSVYVSEEFSRSNDRPVRCESSAKSSAIVVAPTLVRSDMAPLMEALFPALELTHPVIQHEYNKLKRLGVTHPELHILYVDKFSLLIRTPLQDYVVHYLPEMHVFTTSFCKNCYGEGVDTADTVAELLMHMAVLEPLETEVLAALVGDVRLASQRGVPLYRRMPKFFTHG